MKKFKILALVMTCAILLSSFAIIPVSANDATVIEIATAADLKKIGTDANYPLDGNYKLTANINLGGEEWNPIGETDPDATTGFFSGVFDGNGFTISNFKITTFDGTVYPKTWMNRVGFFGIVTGTIKNLTIANATYDANMTSGTNGSRVGGFGAIAGALYNGGKIIGCQTAEDVTITLTQCSYWYQSSGAWKTDNRSYTGGIVGWVKSGTVEYCINRADITRSHTDNRQYYDGGIVGQLETGSISYCINYGDVLTTTKANWVALGGIVGRSTTGVSVVENCINYGTVKNTGADDDLNREAGGIMGTNGVATVTIRNNINLGEVYTEYQAGQTIQGGTATPEKVAAQILGWRNTTHDPEAASGNYGLNTASDGATAVKFGNARKDNMAESKLHDGITLTTEDAIKATSTYKEIVAKVNERFSAITTAPKLVLVGFQAKTYKTGDEVTKYDVRFVSVVNDYEGFATTTSKLGYLFNNGTKDSAAQYCTTIYKKLNYTKADGSTGTLDPADFGGKYFFCFTITDMDPATVYNLGVKCFTQANAEAGVEYCANPVNVQISYNTTDKKVDFTY